MCWETTSIPIAYESRLSCDRSEWDTCRPTAKSRRNGLCACKQHVYRDSIEKLIHVYALMNSMHGNTHAVTHMHTKIPWINIENSRPTNVRNINAMEKVCGAPKTKTTLCTSMSLYERFIYGSNNGMAEGRWNDVNRCIQFERLPRPE